MHGDGIWILPLHACNNKIALIYHAFYPFRPSLSSHIDPPFTLMMIL